MTGVEDFKISFPAEDFQLLGYNSNSFNAGALIKFHIYQPGEVELIVTDLLGQPVRTIKQNFPAAGAKAIRWDTADEQGHPLGSGIYFDHTFFRNLSVVGKMLYWK